MIRSLLLLLTLLVATTCFYDRYSSVKSLVASDFQQVKKGIWLVQFYAQWCGHCRSLTPEYEKAAKALKGIANIAAINADKQRTDIQIKGFPTIKLFVDGSVSDYDGARTADGIVDFMMRKLRNVLLLINRLLMKDQAEVDQDKIVDLDHKGLIKKMSLF